MRDCGFLRARLPKHYFRQVEIAEPDGVAVSKLVLPDAHAVDEQARLAVQVTEDETRALAMDCSMLLGDLAVRKPNLVLPAPAEASDLGESPNLSR